MQPALAVVVAEARRQTRYHKWASNTLATAAAALPVAGATATAYCAGLSGLPPALAWAVVAAASLAACSAGRTSGIHAAAAHAFDTIARSPPQDVHAAAHDLNRAYCIADANDTRDSAVTLRPAPPPAPTAMNEIPL